MDPAVQPQETPTKEPPVDKKPSSFWSGLCDIFLVFCAVVLIVVAVATIFLIICICFNFFIELCYRLDEWIPTFNPFVKQASVYPTKPVIQPSLIMPDLTLAPVMANLTEVAWRYEAQLSAHSRLVEQLGNKTASLPAAVPIIQPEQQLVPGEGWFELCTRYMPYCGLAFALGMLCAVIIDLTFVIAAKTRYGGNTEELQRGYEDRLRDVEPTLQDHSGLVQELKGYQN